MVIFKFEQDGGFIAGDTETRAAAYAYPSSENANQARTRPATVAHEMARAANAMRWHVDAEAFYARLWARLELPAVS